MRTLYIIGAVLAAIVVGAVFIVASTGLIKIPVITSVFGFDKAPDLGIQTDPALFSGLLTRQGVTLTDHASNYCLKCDITYSNPGLMEASLTSSELSSYLQATNNEKGPLKGIQVRLGDNNQAEMAAYADLREHGYDFSGPVYAAGRIEKAGTGSIRLDVQSAKAGLVPIPEGYRKSAEEALEDTINDQLQKMPGLRIDALDIENGRLNFNGNFPKTASAR